MPTPDGFTLDPAAFRASHPFHAVVSRRGEITQVGRGWQRLAPELRAGARFDESFAFVQPPQGRFEAAALDELEGSLLVLEHRRLGLRLRAEVVASGGVFFFLMTPWARGLDALRQAGLRLEDFAAHDAIGDYLVALDAQNALLGEARELAERLAAQKAELARLNERLAAEMEAVQQARDERAQMARRVKEAERLESLGVLAGGAAHDFNNLLVPILANAELLRDEPVGEQGRRCVEEILQASSIAADLCRQMLSYAGRTPVHLELVSLSGVVEEMQELVGSAAPGVELGFELDPRPVELRADSTQVRQIVLNLVLNATEACGAVGGRVTVRTGQHLPGPPRPDEVRMGELSEERSYAYLEVEDDGEGMDAATLERIFDPFFSTKLLGRGLGMAVVFGIVRRHEGAVIVRSAPGRGTRIRVLFPPGNGESSAVLAPAPETPAPALSGRILLVDDDHRVRTVAERILRHHGFDVVSASDGEEALARCRETSHDLRCVLLDLSMPGLGGEAVYRELRAKWPGLPVLLMSGYTGETVAELLGGDPRAGFLHKPFGAEQVLAAIGRVSAPPGDEAG